MVRIQFIVPALVCFLFVTSGLNAQDRVREKHLIGNWKLIIDLEDKFNEAKRDMNDHESIIGRIVLTSVSGIVTGILDEVEIFMEFMPKGELKIRINAFGEKEVEYSRWSIDQKGRLFIEDSGSYASDRDNYWLLQDGVLVSIDGDETEKAVYMVKVD